MALPPQDVLTARFSLRIAGRTLPFVVDVPTAEVSLEELLPALFSFNKQLLDHCVEQETSSGRSISCRAGCGACCRQLVPISPTEAALVRQWTASQENEAAIAERFHQAIAQLRAAGLYDRLREREEANTPESVRALGLDYFKAGCACPFLVDESCSIYPVRPMKCREYLVTSPAINCSEPSGETVSMLDFPLSFLKVLLKMEVWLSGSTQWMPLTFLFEETEQKEALRRPGPELFQRFVAEFVALGSH